jgi:Tat protein translocase TatB subunit
MFGLGMGELLVILVLALLFLGPKRLPDLASTLGKAIRSFRKATSDLTSQLEVDESVKEPFRELQAALRDEPRPRAVATQPPLDQPRMALDAAKPAAVTSGAPLEAAVPATVEKSKP